MSSSLRRRVAVATASHDGAHRHDPAMNGSGDIFELVAHAPRLGANPACRTEAQEFLEAMPEVSGPQARAAVGRSLGLDYAWLDFGLVRVGKVQVFEADAGMVVNPSDPNPIWHSRRMSNRCVLNAAPRMLLNEAGLSVPT